MIIMKTVDSNFWKRNTVILIISFFSNISFHTNWRHASHHHFVSPCVLSVLLSPSQRLSPCSTQAPPAYKHRAPAQRVIDMSVATTNYCCPTQLEETSRKLRPHTQWPSLCRVGSSRREENKIINKFRGFSDCRTTGKTNMFKNKNGRRIKENAWGGGGQRKKHRTKDRNEILWCLSSISKKCFWLLFKSLEWKLGNRFVIFIVLVSRKRF